MDEKRQYDAASNAVHQTEVPANKDKREPRKTTERPSSKPEVGSIPACSCGCGG